MHTSLSGSEIQILKFVLTFRKRMPTFSQSVRIAKMNKWSKIRSLNVLFFHYLKLDADDSSSLVRSWNVAIFISQDISRRVFSINVHAFKEFDVNENKMSDFFPFVSE